MLSTVEAVFADQLLDFKDSIQERFRSRWATRYVYVNRDELVDTLNECGGIEDPSA